jgi:uncharacterized membrane protein
MTTHHTEFLGLLRARAKARRQREPKEAVAVLPERAADWVAAIVGSWRFILVQSGLLCTWIAYNALSGRAYDPYPFILLNLVLSFQAAYTAPIIMMSQNRQSEIDRRRSIDDFEINQKAELEIETLHEKLDHLREREIAALAASVERLTRMLEARTGDAL